MKKMLFIALLFACANLRAETTPDLARYSYFCFAIDKNTSYTGTCFLYQKNGEVYVVSNYHVFYAADLIGKKQVIHVDTLRIRYISTKTNKPQFYKIINSADRVTFFNHYDSPDLMAKRLEKIPEDMPINLINDLMEPSYFDEEPDSVMLFGYPANYTKVNGPEEVEVKQCALEGNFANNIEKFTTEITAGIADKAIVTAVKRKINDTEFQIGVASLPGFSGSPVYGRFERDGRQYYKFIGVVFAANQSNNFSIGIKGKVFYDFIKNLSAQADD